LLLSHHGDPNLQDKDGSTVLHLAVAVGNIEVVQTILVSNFPGEQTLANFHLAEPNLQDKRGNTALHIASEKSNIEIARLLLQAKSSPNQPNMMKRTSLHVAAQKSTNGSIVEELIRANATIDIQDQDLNTPLHLAYFSLNSPAACQLVLSGASVCLPNITGLTPFDAPPPGTFNSGSDFEYTTLRTKLLGLIPREPTWLPDQMAILCQICKKKVFGVATRRHHCRHCGRVVCDGCSPKKIVISKFALQKEAVRVCSQCHPVVL